MEESFISVSDEVPDTPAALWVVHRAHHPDRLVDRQVDRSGCGGDAFTVDPHDDPARIDSKPLCADRDPVHGDPTGLDQLLGTPPAGDTRRCQYFLQANTLIL
jgi:hypothetical protein